MKTNKNNKKEKIFTFRNILKFMFIVLLTMFLGGTTFAGELIYDQNTLVTELNENKVGNVQLFDLVGSKNLHLTGTQDYDLVLEYPELRNDMYIYFQNTKVNSTITLIWNFDLSTTGQRYTQNFTMLETGNYIFKINNNIYGEPMRFFIETNDDSYIATVYTQQKIEKGIPEIMETLVNNVNDLIDINMSIWKIVYYLFIFSIVMSLIFLIVLLGAKMYDFAKKHSISNKVRSNHK